MAGGEVTAYSDLPAQPVLINVRHNGRKIPAVAQVTKMGFVFILDRITGTPLFPLEEHPVPKSEVPGEGPRGLHNPRAVEERLAPKFPIRWLHSRFQTNRLGSTLCINFTVS